MLGLSVKLFVPDVFFFGEAEEGLPALSYAGNRQGGASATAYVKPQTDSTVSGSQAQSPAFPIRQAVARMPPPPAARLPLIETDASGTIRLTVDSVVSPCSFCFEGYERKPYREHTIDALLAQAKSLKRFCGARIAELDAFNLNNYSKLGELVEECARLFEKLSFKSQRADGIAACPEIIDLERAAGKSSSRCASKGSAHGCGFLEVPSRHRDRLRDQSTLDRRVRELKLFFILTAYETPEDLEAFSDFCLRIKVGGSDSRMRERAPLSFGRLVRMPNTPLSYDRLFLEDEEWRFSVDGVAAACRRAQLECRFAFDYPDYLGTQLLAACSHDAAAAVVALACEGLSYHGPWRAEEAARLRTAISLNAAVRANDLFPIRTSYGFGSVLI